MAPWRAAVLLVPTILFAQEWPFYGGDQGGSKYSPLDQINRANIAGLQVAWEWKTGEGPLAEFKTTPGTFEVTPIMTGGVLYLSTPYNRVVALDAETGRELWSYDPKARGLGRLEVKLESFGEVCKSLFLGLSLTGDIDFQTLRDIPVALAPDSRGEQSLHMQIVA